MLEIRNLSKKYTSGSKTVSVLKDINFKIEAQEIVSIVGPSGSGKTTLLGLCAGLDKATTGTVILNSKALEPLSEDERAKLRNDCVGFIFQNFQLIPTLTALENIMVPLELRGISGSEKKAMDLLEKVGLADRHDHYPTQLSGGEQQRVAVARSLINQPAIIFADEPTGNLDTASSDELHKLLFNLRDDFQQTFVIVTHNEGLADMSDRKIEMQDGRLSK